MFIHSTRKTNFCAPNILRKMRAGHTRIKTMSRASTVLRACIGKQFFIYDGMDYVKVHVQNASIGHKLGAFVNTKKICVFRRRKRNRKYRV